MINKTEQYKVIKQVLESVGDQRAKLITQINDSELRHHIEGIINDQQAITQHFDQGNSSNNVDVNHKPEDLESGTKINRITIEKMLGKGGMGSVYQGYDEKLKRKVAIKSIRSEYLQVESTHQRFIREAQILSKINHPSICHIYDYIETDSRDYLVLELIHGKQLNEVFLDYDELLKVILKLAKALEAAHKHGIVHRDLKPDNIMITDEHQVKVLDFGIAQSLSNPMAIKSNIDENENNHSGFTKQGSLVGTIRYMSPEQARGEPLSTASDIYSLGIIIQELFSHENAYEATETFELLDSVQRGETSDFTCTFKPITKLIKNLCQLLPENRPSATDVCVEIENIILAPKKKKKRILQIVGLFIITGLIVVMGLQWRESMIINNSSELAKTYTDNINQLVREAEQIYVLPKHDIKSEIEQVLERGTQLYIQIDNDTLLTEKDRTQLHGLIYLESEDFETAVDFLERSNANPNLLARAWIGLYIDKTSDYSSIYGVSKALQAEELREKYLTPAIKYINNTAQPNAVHEAFKIALTESLDAGLVLLNEIIQEQSWDKKAIRLKAEILLTQADTAIQAGNWDTAKSLYLLSIENFEQATEMARSYPENYLGLCQVNNILLFDSIQRTGQDIELHSRKAIQACENYLITLPGDEFAINLLARIHLIMAQGEILHDFNPMPHIDKAEKWILQSSDTGDDYGALWTKALFHNIKAMHLLNTGHLDNTDINLAIDYYKKSIIFAPSNQSYLSSDLISAYGLQADLLFRKNLEIIPTITKAEYIFEQSINNTSLLIGDKREFYLDMASVYFVQLKYDYINGENIVQIGEKLLELFELATNELLVEPKVELNIANVHLLLAESQIDASDINSVKHHLTSANQSIEKTEMINANHPNLLLSKLWLQSLYAHLDNEKYTVTDKMFLQISAEMPNNDEINFLWAKYLLTKSQKITNQLERNTLVETAKNKIQKALRIDSSNRFYLRLEEKLNSI